MSLSLLRRPGAAAALAWSRPPKPVARLMTTRRISSVAGTRGGGDDRLVEKLEGEARWRVIGNSAAEAGALLFALDR